MTVKELIRQLNKIANKDAEIFISDNSGGSYPMQGVEIYIVCGKQCVKTTSDNPDVDLVEFV